MELARLVATCAASGMPIPHTLQGLQLRVDTHAAAAAMRAPQPAPAQQGFDAQLAKQLQRVVDEGAGVLQGQARFLATLRARMVAHVGGAPA